MCSHFEVYGSHDYLEMAPSCPFFFIQGLQIMFWLVSTWQTSDHSQGAQSHISCSVLQPCCKQEKKAVQKNVLLQSTLVSQTISVPFRRQTGCLWILNGGNITYFLDRFNVWWGARWGSRCVCSFKYLKMCVVSNAVTSFITFQLSLLLFSCYGPVFPLVQWFPGSDLSSGTLLLAHRFPPCL